MISLLIIQSLFVEREGRSTAVRSTLLWIEDKWLFTSSESAVLSRETVAKAMHCYKVWRIYSVSTRLAASFACETRQYQCSSRPQNWMGKAWLSHLITYHFYESNRTRELSKTINHFAMKLISDEQEMNHTNSRHHLHLRRVYYVHTVFGFYSIILFIELLCSTQPNLSTQTTLVCASVSALV